MIISSTAPQSFVPIYPNSDENVKFTLSVFHSLHDLEDILVLTELNSPKIIEKAPIEVRLLSTEWGYIMLNRSLTALSIYEHMSNMEYVFAHKLSLSLLSMREEFSVTILMWLFI